MIAGRIIFALSVLAVYFLSAAAYSQTGSGASSAGDSPEIWFGPRQDAFEPGKGVTFSKYDFPQLVASTKGWERAAGEISTMDLNLVHIVEAYPDLASVVRWANDQPVKLAGGGSLVNTGMAVPGGGPSCSHPPIEGMGDDPRFDFAGEVYFTLHTWKQKGGRLDYLTMDGPFFFTYYYAKNFCNYTIEEAAQRTAITVNKILADFPDAEIVDYEGPTKSLPEFFRDYEKYIKAFDALSMKPISRIGMDMHWADNQHDGYRWVDATRAYAKFAHAHSIKAGLFMDAEDQFVQSPDGSAITTTPVTNQSWMKMARDHIQLAHASKLPLDFMIITSWMKFPALNLPETDSLALTSLVDDAFRLWYPNCALQRKTYAACAGDVMRPAQ